ncbi:hypothetical protein Golomagni_01465 [Golovinomyces magnicellulatus]|nr:hypothetical protein Golomagni_01465 [Golovinomyces magnicellulatus]
MATPAPLFTLSVPRRSSEMKETPHRTIVCTKTESVSGPIYLLTFALEPDNRLDMPFLKNLMLALDIIEFSYPHGVVVTTSGIPKFYSNGLDLKHARETPNFFTEGLYAVFQRFIAYPMPTVALINGHAFAGGLMLAMYHDYRVMNPSKGFVCLNELDFGVSLQPAMSSIFRQKLRPEVYRMMVLEAHRFTGIQAYKYNIVDELGSFPEIIAFVENKKLAKKHISGIYGLMRAEMYRETLSLLENYEQEVKKSDSALQVYREKEKSRRKVVEEWKNNTVSQSKL